jgi:Arc/MetJ-type ribon-helix-helix transcriptional regulator
MVQAGVDSGRFANADEYIAEAIELLDLRLAYDEECRLLDESIAQGERGEVFTKEESERDLDELRARWLARRQPAA